MTDVATGATSSGPRPSVDEGGQTNITEIRWLENGDLPTANIGAGVPAHASLAAMLRSWPPKHATLASLLRNWPPSALPDHGANDSTRAGQ